MREQSLEKIVGEIQFHNSQIKLHRSARNKLKKALFRQANREGMVNKRKGKGMSPEARERISKFQKARWRKFRANQQA